MNRSAPVCLFASLFSILLIVLPTGGFALDHLFAVGDNGVIVSRDANGWNLMTEGSLGALKDVWGRSADDIYAVGVGTIYHYDGVDWTPFACPTPYEITAIWGVFGNNVDYLYICDKQGGIYRHSGSTWGLVEESYGPINAIWGTDHKNVYAAGCCGVIMHFNGYTWSTIRDTGCDLDPLFGQGSEEYITGIWGSGPYDIYFAGLQIEYDHWSPYYCWPMFLHYNGSSFTKTYLDTDGWLPISVWGSSSTDVYISQGEVLYHYDGASWSNIWTITPAYDVFGYSWRDVFAARSASVRHYDGYAWSTETCPTTSTLRALWGFTEPTMECALSGTPSGDLFLAGWQGDSTLQYVQDFIGYRDGDCWSMEMPFPSPDKHLSGMWACASDNIYAVGDGCYVTRYNGSAWTEIDIGTTKDLNDVHGLSAGNLIFVVGEKGFISRYNGSSWSSMATATYLDLNAVWVVSASAAFVCGEKGKILQYTGAWSNKNSGTYADLLDIWAPSSSDAFAVGTGGKVLHYNGTSWSNLPTGVKHDLRSVWGTSGDNVVIVGDDGIILRYDGVSITTESSGGIGDLHTVCGTSADDIYAFGEDDKLMHYDGISWQLQTTTCPTDARTPQPRIALRQNHPNPFNPSTTVDFDLPTPCHVKLQVFDTAGKQVAVLADRLMPAGGHTIEWDGRNDRGTAVASGVYFLRLSAGGESRRIKMILMR